MVPLLLLALQLALALAVRSIFNMEKRRIVSEFIGTMFLIIIVVGSGIMGERLAAGNIAIALLANAIATGAGLFILISIFGPISGAHFNPAVSTYFKIRGELKTPAWISFIAAQIVGGLLGIVIVHFIFEVPIIQLSTHSRDGWPQMASEFVATIGLLFTIVGFVKFSPSRTALGVASYITGAYWFTSSTSFANPAVTIARSFTNTFAGIAPHSVAGYLAAQVLAVFIFASIEVFVFGELQLKEKS